MFGKYGEITSLKVMTAENIPAGLNSDKKGKKFGFICYKTPDSASAAQKELNGKEIDGKQLYVNFQLTKTERQAQLAKEEAKFKNSKKRCNLYVKNIDQTQSEESLRQIFEKFGTIDSIKLF